MTTSKKMQVDKCRYKVDFFVESFFIGRICDGLPIFSLFSYQFTLRKKTLHASLVLGPMNTVPSTSYPARATSDDLAWIIFVLLLFYMQETSAKKLHGSHSSRAFSEAAAAKVTRFTFTALVPDSSLCCFRDNVRVVAGL